MQGASGARKIPLFLCFSVFSHLLLLLIGLPGTKILAPKLSDSRAVELVDEKSLLPTHPPKKSRVVDSEVAGIKAKPTGPSHFGSQDQKVETETRAADSSKFRAGNTSPAEKLSLSDLGINSDWRQRAGSTDDNLEGVSPSSRTILNTRKHRYHSFYARVKDELRLYWKPEVEERALRLAQKGSWPEGKKLVTEVVVLLDSSGKIVQISTAKSSGYHEIDGAADYAFEKVGRFQNLPKAMIDSDGYARLYWDFILLANGSQPVRMADNSPPAVNRID